MAEGPQAELRNVTDRRMLWLQADCRSRSLALSTAPSVSVDLHSWWNVRQSSMPLR